MLEIGAIILGTATIITQVITLKELICVDRYLKAKRKQEDEEYQKWQKTNGEHEKIRPTEDDEAIEKFIDDYLSASEKNRHQ